MLRDQLHCILATEMQKIEFQNVVGYFVWLPVRWNGLKSSTSDVKQRIQIQFHFLKHFWKLPVPRVHTQDPSLVITTAIHYLLGILGYQKPQWWLQIKHFFTSLSIIFYNLHHTWFNSFIWKLNVSWIFHYGPQKNKQRYIAGCLVTIMQP